MRRKCSNRSHMVSSGVFCETFYICDSGNVDDHSADYIGDAAFNCLGYIGNIDDYSAVFFGEAAIGVKDDAYAYCGVGGEDDAALQQDIEQIGGEDDALSGVNEVAAIRDSENKDKV